MWNLANLGVWNARPIIMDQKSLFMMIALQQRQFHVIVAALIRAHANGDTIKFIFMQLFNYLEKLIFMRADPTEIKFMHK